jgi:hypothetical protein
LNARSQDMNLIRGRAGDPGLDPGERPARQTLQVRAHSASEDARERADDTRLKKARRRAPGYRSDILLQQVRGSNSLACRHYIRGRQKLAESRELESHTVARAIGFRSRAGAPVRLTLQAGGKRRSRSAALARPARFQRAPATRPVHFPDQLMRGLFARALATGRLARNWESRVVSARCPALPHGRPGTVTLAPG